MSSKAVFKMKITIVSLTLVIGTMLTILGAFIDITKPISIILLSFGATFTASAIISFIMLMSSLSDLKTNVHEIVTIIGDRLDLSCLSRFTLIESSQNIGLTNIYKNRTEALKSNNFSKIIQKEEDEIIIAGSSLVGLLQDRHFSHILEILKKRLKKETAITFMLIHPLFSYFRAEQEGFESEDIGKNIIKSLKLIKSELISINSLLVSVYLYHGTPTCFGIYTTNGMLINPYPYGHKAYDSICFEFSGNSYASNYFKKSHFLTHYKDRIQQINLLSDTVIGELETQLGTFAKKTREFDCFLINSAQ